MAQKESRDVTGETVSTMHCLAVCGGSRAQRAEFITRHLAALHAAEGITTALVISPSPRFFSQQLAAEATHNTVAVEVRDDNPAALASSYASRMEAPASSGPAMLLRDAHGSVAQSLSWEYMRRAAESGAWHVVIREMDGNYAALAALSAPRRAAEVIEQLWPRNTRLAGLAAGESLDPVVRDAHEIAGTLDVLAGWLTAVHPTADIPPIEVHGVGADAENRHIAEVATLLGAAAFDSALIEGPQRVAAINGLPSYRQRVSVPTEPDTSPVVLDGDLHLRFSGIDVQIPLAGVLARCIVHAVEFTPENPEKQDPSTPHITLTFVADPALWPESLLASFRHRTSE